MALLVCVLLLGAASAQSTALLSVVNLNGEVVAKHSMELDPSAPAPTGTDLMIGLKERGALRWQWSSLGGKMVVNSIEGVQHTWPKTTWVLGHHRAGHGGVPAGVDPNAAMGEVRVHPGDSLVWTIVYMHAIPKPAPLEKGGREEEAEEEGGHVDSDEGGHVEL